jgi:DNA-binding MarR family transcriptional regulator
MYVDINVFEEMSSSASVPFATTLHIRDCCLCLHVQRVARALLDASMRSFVPTLLPMGSFPLVMSLNRPEPPGMASVSSLLGMDRTTLTTALKPLERRGLVKVATDSSDRRSRRMSLTPEGRTVLASTVPVWERTHLKITTLLDDGDVDCLRRSLRALA